MGHLTNSIPFKKRFFNPPISKTRYNMLYTFYQNERKQLMWITSITFPTICNARMEKQSLNWDFRSLPDIPHGSYLVLVLQLALPYMLPSSWLDWLSNCENTVIL